MARNKALCDSLHGAAKEFKKGLITNLKKRG